MPRAATPGSGGEPDDVSTFEIDPSPPRSAGEGGEQILPVGRWIPRRGEPTSRLARCPIRVRDPNGTSADDGIEPEEIVDPPLPELVEEMPRREGRILGASDLGEVPPEEVVEARGAVLDPVRFPRRL